MSDLNIVEKVIALEGVELLKNLTPDQLSRIATIAAEVRYPSGKAILDADKPLDALYVVLDGAVELGPKDGPTTVAKQNDVVGAWALFDADALPVAARTVADTKLLRIGRDDFYDLLSDNMEITASIFSILVKRFRQLIEEQAR
jgi:signal-transduction protein with cAMP-binding, CBS, and nucleotidyltransferase domain